MFYKIKVLFKNLRHINNLSHGTANIILVALKIASEYGFEINIVLIRLRFQSLAVLLTVDSQCCLSSDWSHRRDVLADQSTLPLFVKPAFYCPLLHLLLFILFQQHFLKNIRQFLLSSVLFVDDWQFHSSI